MIKLNKEYVRRDIAGEILVVPTGSAAQKVNGLITLNEVAGVIWDCLEQGYSTGEIVAKILENYEVDEATAAQNVEQFLGMLEEQGILVEEEKE